MIGRWVAMLRRWRTWMTAVVPASRATADTVIDDPAAIPCDILLARTGDAGTTSFGFVNPSPALVDAFAPNQLFLVITNPAPLGQQGDDLPSPVAVLFRNHIQLADWDFAADLGVRDNGPPTIMIVKYAAGALCDLVTQPDHWYDPATFCGADHPADVASQLNALFQSAQAYDGVESSRYRSFVERLADPDWQGILILHPTVVAFPPQLMMMHGCLPEGQRMMAHHIAINGPQFALAAPANAFPVSGLIDYQGPDLTLMAEFENSRITAFSAEGLPNRRFIMHYQTGGAGGYVISDR